MQCSKTNQRWSEAVTDSSVPAGKSEKQSTAEQILDAAERVVARDGARLTIDAVVKESGFSKGGVLYNFPSKLALIEGMVSRMCSNFELRHETAKQDALANDQSVVPAMVCAMLEDKDIDRQVSMGLLAAMAENPELIGPVRESIAKMREDMLSHAPDPVMACIALLAADGLHFSEILGLDVLTPDQREAVEARLIQLLSESPQ